MQAPSGAPREQSNTQVPFECKTAPLKVVGGKIKVPTGPGLGVEIDPEFIQKHKPVTCQLWDKLRVRPGVKTAPDGKRRLTAPAWTPEDHSETGSS